MIYAFDFDGTLCENRWPEIGPVRKKGDGHGKANQGGRKHADSMDLPMRRKATGSHRVLPGLWIGI